MEKSIKTLDHQHIRYNPLRGEWILVSPHRAERPWSGQIEDPPNEDIPQFDPKNPLCPGVTRASGLITPDYKSTFVFTNDFPALLENGPNEIDTDDPLFKTRSAKGTCRVICYHPHSNIYFTSMPLMAIVDLINEWIKQTNELGKIYKWVQIFENRGSMMGCSNPHPHGQIWASDFLPTEPHLKNLHQKEYYEKYGRPMLMDYLMRELKNQERIVYENDEWVVLVPYWAVWPYETMLLPKRHIQRIVELDEKQKTLLAEILQILVAKYDNIFKCKFPYSWGWIGAPTGDEFNQPQPWWTLHACFYPPLLRSATIKKFMVGYEMLAQAQRDLTPETAAKTIREQSEIRFSDVK